MNEENTLKLINSYPDLFRGHKKPMTESLMCFGFECGDGWFLLIWNLAEALECLAREEGRTDNWPEVVQVKQKLGGLSFYMDGSSKAMFEKIFKAAKDSEFICERCGAPGMLKNEEGWWSTLCEPCRAKK